MSKISAIIITNNEEKNIFDCVNSLEFTDEIIIIDNGSTDKTLEIAKEKKAKIFQVQTYDFSEIRQEGKNQAKYEWLLYIDADERVSDILRSEIRMAVKEDKYTAYSFIRKNYFFGKLWPKEEEMVRLIKKEALIRWDGRLHETPIFMGEKRKLEGFLLHFTHNDLKKMVEKTNKWSETEARLRYDANHPFMSWWRFFRVMITAFYRSYIIQGGWKAGTTGLIESIYQSFSMFITYAKLWEIQNKNDK
jgi:glycosyltransferase involved in cell wall biosynthesis